MTHFSDLTKFAISTDPQSLSLPIKKHYAGLSVFSVKAAASIFTCFICLEWRARRKTAILTFVNLTLEELEVDGNPSNLDVRSGRTPRRLPTAHLDVSLYYSRVNPSLSAAAAPDTMQLPSRVWERKTTQC